MSDSQSDDDGVMGYQVTTVTQPNMAPMAAAALPSMMILPAVAVIRSMAHRACMEGPALTNSRPLSIAGTLGSMALCFPFNCLLMAATVSSRSMPIQPGTITTSSA